MTALRRLLAGFLLLVGIGFLLVWAAAAAAIHALNDGAVVSSLATTALHQPAVQSAITSKAQDLVGDNLAEQGIDLEALGLSGGVDQIIADLIASDAFAEAISGVVDGARSGLAEQLTDPDAAGQPITISLDLATPLNDALQSTPVIGDVLPDLTLPPADVPVMDASTSGKVRGVYGWVDRAATFAGWIGLVLVALGIWAWPRKRWLIPIALLWIGVSAALLWALVAVVPGAIVDRIAGANPGLGDTLGSLVPLERLDSLQGTLGLATILSLIASAIAFVAVKAIFSKRDAPGGAHAEKPTPTHAAR